MPSSSPATLLDQIAWEEINDVVQRQQRNRERYTPGISLYRWWARRPHALIDALIDGACADGSTPTISDPLSGGGTVAMEAARRRLPVYAQDLHPWAAAGLGGMLDGADPGRLRTSGELWLGSLEELRTELYRTPCAIHGHDSEVLNTFWARSADCPACSRDVYLFPYSMLTLASRSRDESVALFGCRACGHVTRSGLGARRRKCSACRRRLEPPEASLLEKGVVACPHSGCAKTFGAFTRVPSWTPVLVQRTCTSQRGERLVHFARPSGDDLEKAGLKPAETPEALSRVVPGGLETDRLRRAGIRRWIDLYPPRQRRVLLEAIAAIREVGTGAEIADRFRLIVCGAAEMAGYASRWDRYYPKAFEATANHRYNLTGFACEVNLLSPRGRGTLPRRLTHSVTAAKWTRDLGGAPARLRGSRSRGQFEPTAASAVVVRGSSTRQLLPDSSVDLVITDPPYFDDVQYAELAALFLAWAQASGLVPASLEVDLRSEAVANTRRGQGTTHYTRLLTRILSETRRTLRPRGRMLLTFHNTDGRAWWSLARALRAAGFVVTALAVAHAENETDHSKRGRRAFAQDLVIECRAVDSPPEVIIATPEAGGAGAELLAAGQAIADLCAQPRKGAGSRGSLKYRWFARRYWHHLGESGDAQIQMPGNPQRRVHAARSGGAEVGR